MRLGPDIQQFNSLRHSSGWNYPRVGDVIFVGPPSKGVAAKGQSFLRQNSQGLSHVAVNFTGDVSLHSTPENGIHFEDTSDLLIHRGRHQRFRVFRYQKFQEADIALLFANLQTIIAPTVGKKYNYALFVDPRARYLLRRSSSDNAFCSELVHNLYASLGITTSDKRSFLSLPADILNYMAADSAEWIEVTGLYGKYLRDETADSELGLRDNIRLNQRKSLNFAMNVRNTKVRNGIYVSQKRIAQASPWYKFFRFADIAGYSSARSAYFAYARFSRHSMSIELRQGFLSKRRWILRRFLRYRQI